MGRTCGLQLRDFFQCYIFNDLGHLVLLAVEKRISQGFALWRVGWILRLLEKNRGGDPLGVILLGKRVFGVVFVLMDVYSLKVVNRVD